MEHGSRRLIVTMRLSLRFHHGMARPVNSTCSQTDSMTGSPLNKLACKRRENSSFSLLKTDPPTPLRYSLCGSTGCSGCWSEKVG